MKQKVVTVTIPLDEGMELEQTIVEKYAKEGWFVKQISSSAIELKRPYIKVVSAITILFEKEVQVA